MEITLKHVNTWVYILYLLSPHLVTAETENIVPVILWSGKNFNSLINPLHKTTKPEFEGIIANQLGKDLLPIVVFIKDHFCIEDIRHHKKSFEQLSFADSLTFLTSVESPISVFNNLSTYNITVEDDLDIIHKGQLVFVQITDLGIIPDISNMLRESNANIIIGITGKFCSYSFSERIKREAGIYKTTKSFVVKHKEILFYADQNPSIKFRNEEYTHLGNPTLSKPVIINNNYYLIMIFENVPNKIGKMNLTAQFNHVNGYFEFIGFRLEESELPDKEIFLKNKFNIYYPFNFSYHCSRDTIFTSKFKNSTILLKISNMQVQMDPRGDRFNDAYDCVGFMSIPIWTGIFVIIILVIIMICGLTMIIDIHTMDHFDDPKGKTITISVQE